MKQAGAYINGKWQEGQAEKLQSIDPGCGKIIWEGKAAGPVQIVKAVEAATNTFPQWSNLTLQQRIDCLQNYINTLKQQQSILTELISQETGKPLWEAATEITTMLGKLNTSVQAYYARCTYKKKLLNSTILTTQHKPHGVIAVIGPFNFPGHLPNSHIIPALLAGNTIVFKPSEYTPMVTEKIFECWDDAGLPPGTINLLQGGTTVAKYLIQQDIQALCFTGSYSTGKSLHKSFAGRPEILLALEMGGNNPLIVNEIQNIETAIITIIQSAFITSGQRCTCARRLILTRNSQNKELLKQLIKKIQTLAVNYYQHIPEPFMGPVISIETAKNLLKIQQQLENDGANILLKMSKIKEHTGLLTPGLIDVTNLTDLQDQEIFGPLLQVIWVDNFKQAIITANNTKYGLAAGLLSNNADLFQQFYTEIKAGIINWNHPLTGASGTAPFGGIRSSGNHRASAFYAADYCAYPVASMQCPELNIPQHIPPGLESTTNK